MGKPWLLLDRDDTILDDPGYLSDPSAVKFLPGAIEGLQRFQAQGWPLVVVTNQSGIGRGYYTEGELTLVHARFEELLRSEGVQLAGLYHCPHAPNEGCACRKPATKMAEDASNELGLRLPDAVMVGDKASDLEFGRRIGARYVAQILLEGRSKEKADGHFFSLKELALHLLS